MAISFSQDSIDQVLSRYPTPIADAVAGLESSDSAHERRDRVVEVFRAVIRLLGAMALAARVQFGPGAGEDSARIRVLLRGLRRRGLTDGQWLELLRLLLKPWAAESGAYPLPELVDLVHGHRSRFPRLIDALLGMRKAETVAHGATGEADDIEEVLQRRMPQLADLLELLRPLWQRVQLAVPLSSPANADEAQRAWRLAGQTPHRGRWRRFDLAVGIELPPGEPLLVDQVGKPLLALYPVGLFRRPTPEGVEELFVLDGGGRGGARFVAIPSMAEHREARAWAALEAALLETGADATVEVPGTARPYRGLESFDTRHAALFFGREEQTEGLANRIRRHPLVTVTGPSGSGKTSLLAAGVLPQLRENLPVVVRPGAHPARSLARRLAENLAGWLDPESATDLVRSRPEDLGDSLSEWCRNTGQRLVVVVDQAEELFTLCDDADRREAFAAAVSSIGSDGDGPLRVVLSVREDFFGQLAMLRSVRGRYNRQVEVVTTPDREALVRTLVMPLQAFGYEFEGHDLVGEMVDAVSGEPAALALLQFCADRLWASRDRAWKQLTRSSYEAVGGVEGALAQHAERTLQGLTGSQGGAARALLLRLVTGERTRAVVPHDELVQAAVDPADAEVVLGRLVESRLVTAGEDGTIELVHEALIRHWDRLAGWLDEDQEGQRLLHALGQAAREWDARGRPDGLLWRGEVLDEYRVWRRRSEAQLTEVESAFATASEGAAERARRSRQLVMGVAVATLVVFAAFMAWQWSLADRARMQTESALSRSELSRLVAEARRAEAEGKPGEALARFRAATVLEANLAGNQPDVTAISADMVRLAADNVAYRVIGGTDSPACASPDASKLVVWDDSQGIPLVLDTTTGEVLARGHGRTAQATAGPLVDASFSPDGSAFLTSTGDVSIRVWDATSGTLKRRLAGYHKLYAASLTRNGESLMLQDVFGVEVWDVETGEQLFAEEEQLNVPREACALSPDGGLLAIGSRVLRMPEGDLLHDLPYSNAGSLVFSNDSLRLAVLAGDHGQDLVVWDMTNGARLRTFSGHEGWTTPPRFSTTDDTFATAGYEDGFIRIWTMEEEAARHEFDWETDGQTRVRLSFSPDGSRLAVSKKDKVRIWQIESGTQLEELSGIYDFGLHQTAATMEYGGTPPRLVIGNRVWEERPSLHVARTPGFDFVPTPDGTSLVYWWGHLWAMDMVIGRHWATTGSRDESLTAIALSTDGGTLARATRRGTLEVTCTRPQCREYQELALREVSKDDLSAEPAVINLGFTRDDGGIIAIFEDGSIRVWEKTTRPGGTPYNHVSHSLLVSLPPHLDFGPIACSTIMADGDLVATGDQDGVVRIVDVATGSLLHTLRHPGAPAREGVPLAASADGSRLVVACEDGSVHLWHLADGEKLVEVRGNASASVPWEPRVAIARDGEAFAVAGGSEARVYDASTGNVRARLSGHEDAIAVMAFSPDGRLLATGSMDRTARLWDLDSGRNLLVLAADTHGVSRLAFSASGDHLTTGTWDGVIDHWRIPNLDPATVLHDTGIRSNLRVCRDSMAVVPVIPLPAPETVWAPASACAAEPESSNHP